jgi:alkylation response protein AidB-like acyl-CoA dehydrogenase
MFEIESLNDEESLLKKEVHRFAEEVIRPVAVEIDQMSPEEYQEKITRRTSPYWRVMKGMKELGYHRSLIPKQLGGGGLTGSEVYILVEEIAWGSSGFSIALGVDLYPLIFAVTRIFDKRIRKEYLGPYLEDKEAKFQGCWAITEPDHGSDTLRMNTFLRGEEKISPGQVTAKKDGDEWVINGQKSSFISAAPLATHAALHTDIDLSVGSPGRGCIVPLDLEGVEKGKPILKIGQKECPQGELIFNDVRIPDGYMSLQPSMLHPDTGAMSITQILCITSAWMAASSTGLARAAFEEALKYARDRVQGGKPICEHQLVQKKLYDMFIKVETSRAYAKKVMEHVWDRMFRKLRWDASYAHCLAAQVYCKERAFEVAHDALQIFGGYGVTKDFLIEKLFRDARVKLIEDGTTDVLALESAEDMIKRYNI